MDKENSFRERELWNNETKIEIFRKYDVKICRKRGEPLLVKNTVPTVKHGERSMMLWDCLSSRSTENLVVIEEKIKSDYYIAFLDEHVKTTPKNLGLGRRWVIQQNYNQKHGYESLASKESADIATMTVNESWLEHNRKIYGKNWKSKSNNVLSKTLRKCSVSPLNNGEASRWK